MKKILIIAAVAAVVTACNSNANNSEGKHNTYTFKDSVKIIRDSLRLDSFERAEQARKDEERKAEELAAAKAQARREGAASVPRTTVINQQAPAQQQKKGWSDAAKGAVIGAGAGAVTGVLIDKKDGRGAAIGGAIGAGTGYLIGRKKDRESGRVQK